MRHSKKLGATLWVLQVFFGLFFILASGAPKLIVPADSLPMPIPLPDPVLVLIGVAEILGGLGLILPGLTRVRPSLTPLAAAGLVLVLIGATVYQLMAAQPGNAVFAVVVGAIMAFIAYARWRIAPLRGSAATPALQPAA